MASSSLSISTRTSMRLETSLRGLALELLLEPGGHAAGHEVVEGPAEGGDLLHAARAEKAVLRRGHHVDGLDVGGHLAVELVHLEFILEVRDGAQPFDDGVGAVLSREIDDQPIKGFYLHIREFLDLRTQHPA